MGADSRRDPGAYYRLAWRMARVHANSGHGRRAIEFYERAIAGFAGENGLDRSKLHLELGAQWRRLGQLALALRETGRAAIAHPSWPEPFAALAELYREVADGEAAALYLEIAASIPPLGHDDATPGQDGGFQQPPGPELPRVPTPIPQGVRPAPMRPIRVVAGGDACLARQLPGWVDDKGVDWPFQGIRETLRQADLVFANLECVLSTQGDFFDKNGRRPYYYRSHPEMLDVLIKAGFGVVNVANNHAFDFGPAALEQELAVLDSCGLACCGGGRDAVEAASPAFIEVDGLMIAFIGLDTETGLAAAKTGSAGINYAAEANVLKTLAGSVAMARAHADCVVFTPHWGKNWGENPTPSRRELARQIIDLGVDAILGHSAHIIQGIEVYRGRPIVYDMGTLLFDRIGENRLRFSALYELEIGSAGVTALTVTPIRLRAGRVGIAGEEDAQSIRELITRLSAELDPTLSFEAQGGKLLLSLAPPKRPTWPRPLPPRYLDPHEIITVPDSYRESAINLLYDRVPDACRWPNPVVVNDTLRVLGARIAGHIRPGYGFLCEVFFGAERPVGGRWEARVSAWDKAGTKVFDYTNPIADGAWPQSRWKMEDIVGDRIVVRPPADLTEGVYRLTWALVDRQTGSTMAADSGAAQIYQGAVEIGELHIDRKMVAGVGGIAVIVRDHGGGPDGPLSGRGSGMPTLSYLKQFDKRQLFRFFVDGRFHTKYGGWRGYEEHEPGSTAGMLRGYRVALDHFDLSGGLTLDYIKQVHKACMADVKIKVRTIKPGEFRYLATGFLFRDGNLTRAGLEDLLLQRRSDGTALFNDSGYDKTAEETSPDAVLHALRREKKLRFRPWHPILSAEDKAVLESRTPADRFANLKSSIQGQITTRAQAILDRFNTEVVQAGTEQAQLLAIARVIRDMELLHPFPDGNCRTLASVMMNHLLLYLDLPPSILFDPNLDAQYSVEEFAEEIRRGMESTRRLLVDPEGEEYGYRIGAASAEDVTEFARMSADLVAAIGAFRDTGYAPIASNVPDPGNPERIYLDAAGFARATGGVWYNCDPAMTFKGAATVAPNSKTFPRGYIYFAADLKDWQKGGRNLVTEIGKLYDKGGAAVILDDPDCAKELGKPVLLVKNTSKALDQAAVATRNRVDCKTVLITGTVGKTGAKIQLHHCLKGQSRVHAVLNSANTRGPVFTSLINLRPGDEVEINEMSLASGGTSIGVGRSRVVRPDICFYTNIGPNHMDNHGTVENLVEAKAASVEGLVENGVCIVNSQSDFYEQFVAAILRRKRVPILTFGTSDGDTARILSAGFDNHRAGWKIDADIEGTRLNYFVPLVQQHAPVVSAGILLCVKRLGYDVGKAADAYLDIQPFETMGQLLRVKHENGDFLFYDQSRRGGIQGVRSTLGDITRIGHSGRLVAVIGSIGTRANDVWTQAYHKELAQLINLSPIDRLYTTGPYLDAMPAALDKPDLLVKHSDDLDELARCLKEDLRPGDLLLITGSGYLYLGRLAAKILKFGAVTPVSGH